MLLEGAGRWHCNTASTHCHLYLRAVKNMADLTSMTPEELDALRTPEAFGELLRRYKQLQVRWVQQAVEGALAESRLHRRSVLTGRCGLPPLAGI